MSRRILGLFNPMEFRGLQLVRCPQRYRAASSSAATSFNTLKKTYQKFFDVPEDGRISRHTFESYGSKLKIALEKLDRVEAFFAYAGLMQIADMYRLSKYPEEGGNEHTLEEMCQVLHSTPKDTQVFCATVFSRALFRAIDTNGNGFISRDEWAVHLKVRNSYESDEQALKSFDSLDKNKDGQISMQEFEEAAIKFWTSAGSDDETKNYYGTHDTIKN